MIPNKLNMEMVDWLKEKCTTKFMMLQHKIYGEYMVDGVLIEFQYTDGYEIRFDEEEDLVAFKLRWL